MVHEMSAGMNLEFVFSFNRIHCNYCHSANDVAVACGARLSSSVFMVYSVLLSVSLVAHAPI